MKTEKIRKQPSAGKKWIWRLLFLVALCVFVYSGYQLFHIYVQNYKEGKEKTEITEIAKVPEKVDPEQVPFRVDWAALQAKNPDIIAWIIIPDTDISYPIVQGDDNAYYLTHTYLKNENYAGAIFLDYQADAAFRDSNTFIYGHNVKHGTMFAELEKFKDAAFYQAHPYIYLFTPQGNYRCEVISMYSTLAMSASYTSYTQDAAGYQAYITMIKALAEQKREVVMSSADPMITLSTCSYEQGGEASDARYLLHAKLTPWQDSYLVDGQ